MLLTGSRVQVFCVIHDVRVRGFGLSYLVTFRFGFRIEAVWLGDS